MEPVPLRPMAVERALHNLIGNAVRYGTQAELSLDISDRTVCFTVEDDGRGITPDEAARATEPFFTTKAPGKGSGLGLAIANEIVKLHRGRLQLEPAAPRGTRATVIVPVPREPFPVGATPQTPPREPHAAS